MIAYIQYFPETGTLGVVCDCWRGKPSTEGMEVYAAWPAVGGILEDRWYKYTRTVDAVFKHFDQLPEAVRLAYMLIQ